MKTPLLGLAACCALPLLAVAETDEVIITASRLAETADASLASVSVIDRTEIERRQAQSLPDLLAGLAGVGLANQGGRGKLSSLFVRGTESNHLLVLIDGVKVGSASSGTSAIELLPLAQIERIELVRGPRSGLYGSEAIGGVLQIFTRSGAAPSGPSLGLTLGSDNHRKADIQLAGGDQRAWYSLGLSGEASDGFNACTGDPLSFAGCATLEPDDDGFDSLSGHLSGGWRLANGAELRLNWLRAEGESEFDGSYQNRSEYRQEVLGGQLDLPLNGRWRMEFRAGRSIDEGDFFKEQTPRGRFRTTRDSLSWLNHVQLNGQQQLSLGLDYQRDQLASDTAYSRNTRDNRGGFGQYLGQFGRHSLQLALRRDDNQQFGQQDSGSLAWGYDLTDGLRLTTAYGSAFVAPSFNDLYWPADPVWGGGGNPDLGPETARSLELGLSGELARGDWSINLYRTRIEDLIAYDFASGGMVNLSQARISGVELSLRQQLADWRLAGNLTLQDPEDRSGGPNQGNQLNRRARQMLSVDLDRDLGRYSLGASLHAEGRRYDDLANSRELDGYGRVDLRAGYRFSRRLRLQARLENLLDADYETASFYNQPGRSLLLSLSYRPEW
ncbi:TonB-dependent vitamin B12 receptor [Magnetovirga frankeli]|uniref:TonB-dependent vitamin B12 receptor n=1 Tax=Magnetovirga frankeli TaxID=947516 RepID=UPI0012934210|nr:TonB-dependent vitamin B12 receptor [gamma proteobacterium SS-5]